MLIGRHVLLSNKLQQITTLDEQSHSILAHCYYCPQHKTQSTMQYTLADIQHTPTNSILVYVGWCNTCPHGQSLIRPQCSGAIGNSIHTSPIGSQAGQLLPHMCKAYCVLVRAAYIGHSTACTGNKDKCLNNGYVWDACNCLWVKKRAGVGDKVVGMVGVMEREGRGREKKGGKHCQV